MYVVDTNVVSAGAPGQAQFDPHLVDWMARHGARLYLSVVTLSEVEGGIAKARRMGAVASADRLARWLEGLLHLYSGRVLPLDVEMARLVGGFGDRARAMGQAPDFADLVIAATAASRGYTVLTRNMRHFRPLPVASHDPFESLPTE